MERGVRNHKLLWVNCCCCPLLWLVDHPFKFNVSHWIMIGRCVYIFQRPWLSSHQVPPRTKLSVYASCTKLHTSVIQRTSGDNFCFYYYVQPYVGSQRHCGNWNGCWGILLWYPFYSLSVIQWTTDIIINFKACIVLYSANIYTYISKRRKMKEQFSSIRLACFSFYLP